MASITRADEATELVMITARQLAILLQVSPRQVWRMLSAGRVPQPVRLGGIVRWRMTEVENWLAEGCPVQPAKR